MLALNLFGATGQELRYRTDDNLPESPGTAYTFDPQGNLVQPLTLYVPGEPPFVKVRSSSSFDGFGGNFTRVGDSQDTFEPVGFGGQHGYYTDPQTGLCLLTHRYYDATAGRFLTRDPIGYGGGINLYGFAGNNPVNRNDPDGYYPGGESGSDLHTPSGLPAGLQKVLRISYPEYNKPMYRPRYANVDYNIHAAQNYARKTYSDYGLSAPMNQRGYTYGSQTEAYSADIHTWFYDHVNTGRSMDYKQLATNHPLDFPIGFGLRDGLDAYGNFNYGAVGAALGLPLAELKGAAKTGRFEQWGLSVLHGHPEGSPIDDSESAVEIEAGYNYYAHHYRK